MSWMGRPEFRTLVKMVEPYEYRDRLTLPKFIMNSGGDQFFLPDSSQFYFDDLPGEKYLRYVPNTDHSLKQSDAAESLLAYFQSIVTGTRRPKFSWTFEKDGAIRVHATDRPTEVRLWQATNPNARDFRFETLGPVWVSTPITDQGEGVYLGIVPKPALGWRAFFLEMTFPSGGRYPFKFTTPVRVFPNVLPFPPPKGAKP